MQPLSAPPPTASIPGPWLLFTVSFFTFWSCPTTAQVHIEPVPPHVAEGKDVLLLVRNLPRDVPIIYWYKGRTSFSDSEIARCVITTNGSKNGPAHSGRETIFPNGSLLLRNVNQRDTGFYTLQTFSTNGEKKETFVEFHVHEWVRKPSIKARNTTATKQDSVVLTCFSDDPGLSIRWLLNGQSLQLTGRMMMSQKNSRLSIDSVGSEDAGDYQCEVSNPASSSKSDVLSLFVIATEQNPQDGVPLWTVMITVTGVLVLILLNALGCLLFLTKTSRASVHHDLREPQTPVSFSGPGASDQYAQDRVSSHREATSVYEELEKPSTNIYDRINDTADVTLEFSRAVYGTKEDGLQDSDGLPSAGRD